MRDTGGTLQEHCWNAGTALGLALCFLELFSSPCSTLPLHSIRLAHSQSFFTFSTWTHCHCNQNFQKEISFRFCGSVSLSVLLPVSGIIARLVVPQNVSHLFDLYRLLRSDPGLLRCSIHPCQLKSCVDFILILSPPSPGPLPKLQSARSLFFLHPQPVIASSHNILAAQPDENRNDLVINSNKAGKIFFSLHLIN